MTTRVTPSAHDRSTTTRVTLAVGVDGSGKNEAAVTWAQEEAKSNDCQLMLVGASHNYPVPIPGFSADYSIESYEDHTRQILKGVRSRLAGRSDKVHILVGSGDASKVILEAAQEADLVVVGKRGHGAVKRVLVGSTSIAVAGRSPVPVVIVPDDWTQSAQSTSPIVVGVDQSYPDEAVLDFAFSRAERLAVPLIAVGAWPVPAFFSWSPHDVGRWSQAARELVIKKLTPWSKSYPTVELIKLVQDADPTDAVLDAAEVAQMIVLGRHTGPRHIGGFHLGSTTRGVLHYSECPVAVVPTRPRASSDDVPSEDDAPEF